MITVTAGSLAEDVATLIGESLLLECETEESPFPGLEDRVRVMAPGILSELYAAIVPGSLADGKEITTGPEIGNDGVVSIPLPEDFLKLVCVRMSDWSRPVWELLPVWSPLYRRQASRWNGIRGTPRNPVALLDREGSRSLLRLYSSSPGARLTAGLYLPVPKPDAQGLLSLPESLLRPLIHRLAEAVRR